MGSKHGEDAGWAHSGPTPIDDDSWDDVLPPADLVDDTERYHGRRRVGEGSPWRRWLGVVAILAAVAGTVALVTRPSGGVPGAMSVPSLPASGAAPAVITSEAGSTQSASVPVASLAATAQAAAGTNTASQHEPSGVDREPDVAAPAFGPVTLEAESAAADLAGSAQVMTYDGASGGQVVSGLGVWAEGEAPGTLRITGLDIPSAGSYEIVAYLTTLGALGSRQVVITVSGAQPVSVTFAGGPNCCGKRSIEVELGAGVHTVTLANPAGMAPSVDRIVVRRS